MLNFWSICLSAEFYSAAHDLPDVLPILGFLAVSAWKPPFLFRKLEPVCIGHKHFLDYTSEMEFIAGDAELEALNQALNTPAELEAYKQSGDHYRVGLLPRLLGDFLVWSGNTVYGREASYLKFRAIEVIARVPYHSWESVAYTLLTLFYTDEARAVRLSRTARYARLAQDNETMHVVVISQLAKSERAGVVRHTITPMLFAFFYFWGSYLLYLVNPRASYELNYLFEQHAFLQYCRFLEVHAEELQTKPIASDFLTNYGRHPRSQYEFFLSVRNDELIHRNQSIVHRGEERNVLGNFSQRRIL
jgi:ubiquinol oxidase